MTRWHVWSDGSCKRAGDGSKGETPKGGVGGGGWAAVVEHGSDGWVLRGRELNTTNVQMELRAMIEGLRAVYSGNDVVLHTDSTVALSVFDRWQHGDRLAKYDRHGRKRVPIHRDLWLALMAEFDRVNVEIDMVGRGPSPQHARAHAFAGAEASAVLGRALPTQRPSDGVPPVRSGMMRVAS